MAGEKIERDGKKLASQVKDVGVSSFKTPAGWLAKYLEKNGSGKLFPAELDAKSTKVN